MWENIIIVGQLAAMLTTAGVALGAVRYVNRKTSAEAAKTLAEAGSTKAAAAKTLTDLALTLVEPLNLRIKALEAEVHRLAEKVEQYIRDEVVYQAELHEKDGRIAELEGKLLSARSERSELKERVEHLEDVLRREGFNGDSDV